jgi:hypothetical protein
VKHRRNIFLARVDPIQIPEKAPRDTLRQICVFTSRGIKGSHNALQCVQGAKRRRTIFLAQVGPYGFHKNALGHLTPNLCFYIRWYLVSRSALRCLRDVKRQHTIFHARVGRVWFS